MPNEKLALNELAREVHQRAKDKGFYDNPREIGTLLMLVVSELSEALEADRKNRYAKLGSFENNEKHRNPDSPLPVERSFMANFELRIKDSFEDEIADTMIRLFDLCAYMNIDIEKHIELKLRYNESRELMHNKNY